MYLRAGQRRPADSPTDTSRIVPLDGNLEAATFFFFLACFIGRSRYTGSLSALKHGKDDD